jgi:hypothetical protein
MSRTRRSSQKLEQIKMSFRISLLLILKEKMLLYVVSGMIISFFYNLPVIKYSVTGDNEFRLYDVLGIFLFYFYFKFYKTISILIRGITYIKLLHRFLIWAGFGIILTLLFSIINDRIVFFFQVLLYLYHFWIFYLSSIFIYIFCLNPMNRKRFIYIIIVASMIVDAIVILQNFKIVPFLWSNLYFEAYYGFNSGTLGPNKIVLGMTSFVAFVLAIGVYLEKSIHINKTVMMFSIVLNLYIIMLSGSRTTYLALLIFLVYFSVSSTLKFSYVATLVLTLLFLTININSDLYKKVDEVISYRVTNKIRNREAVKEGKMIELYSDLGSGRGQLSMGNFNYLLENPQIIPFGMGFVNRFSSAPGLSAHNMYIQVIKELGIVGFVLYFGWLLSYLFIDFRQFKGFSLALKGLIFSMLVTLFFGEHLYIYRPLFGFLGLFLVITSIFVSILHKNE